MGNALCPADASKKDLDLEVDPGGEDVDDAPAVADIEPARPTTPAEVKSRKRDKICALGGRCKSREADHLQSEAHPFDPEYAELCRVAGCVAEEPSLRLLFDWVDVDSSGKISRPELETALPLLSLLFGEEMKLSDQAWETLDEDGNGCVNFSELAEWAGPRLGLPLGVKQLFQSGGQAAVIDACGIIGCPCEGFRRQAPDKLQRVRDRAKRHLSHITWAKAFVESDSGRDKLSTCKCGHKLSAHSSETQHNHDCDDVPLPAYWRSARQRDNAAVFSNLVSEESEGMMTLFQALFDNSYRDRYTRDRRKHNPDNPNVPKRFQVVRAFRCENNKFWREYGVRRAQLEQDQADSGVNGFELIQDVKTVVAWNKFAASGVPSMQNRLVAQCNEWYLFHGTSPDRAESICHNDFKISMAGGTTGTLYGRGAYFAESITKADEYAKPNDAGEYAVLVVRVLGGRVNYNDEETPDAESLVRSCIEGPFDCILGDREKCRDTYREFVFYDTENIYAEYILHYKRVY